MFSSVTESQREFSLSAVLLKELKLLRLDR